MTNARASVALSYLSAMLSLASTICADVALRLAPKHDPLTSAPEPWPGVRPRQHWSN